MSIHDIGILSARRVTDIHIAIAIRLADNFDAIQAKNFYDFVSRIGSSYVNSIIFIVRSNTRREATRINLSIMMQQIIRVFILYRFANLYR